MLGMPSPFLITIAPPARRFEFDSQLKARIAADIFLLKAEDLEFQKEINLPATDPFNSENFQTNFQGQQQS